MNNNLLRCRIAGQKTASLAMFIHVNLLTCHVNFAETVTSGAVFALEVIFY